MSQFGAASTSPDIGASVEKSSREPDQRGPVPARLHSSGFVDNCVDNCLEIAAHAILMF